MEVSICAGAHDFTAALAASAQEAVCIAHAVETNTPCPRTMSETTQVRLRLPYVMKCSVLVALSWLVFMST